MRAGIARCVATVWHDLAILIQVLILKVYTDSETSLTVALATELGSNHRYLFKQVEHQVMAILLLEQPTEWLAVFFVLSVAEHFL